MLSSGCGRHTLLRKLSRPHVVGWNDLECQQSDARMARRDLDSLPLQMRGGKRSKCMQKNEVVHGNFQVSSHLQPSFPIGGPWRSP